MTTPARRVIRTSLSGCRRFFVYTRSHSLSVVSGNAVYSEVNKRHDREWDYKNHYPLGGHVNDLVSDVFESLFVPCLSYCLSVIVLCIDAIFIY